MADAILLLSPAVEFCGYGSRETHEVWTVAESMIAGLPGRSSERSPDNALILCERNHSVNNDLSSSKDRIAQVTAGTVSQGILAGIEELITEAQARTRPLEVDPYRSRLFEYFVTADQSGLIPDEREIGAFQNAEEDDEGDLLNLSADSLCRLLARRWGLDMAAREAQVLQTRLAADQLERMRLLWSVMRMWMEWSYAWRRWSEFHGTERSEVTNPE